MCVRAPEQLLPFIQTWSARWAGARRGIVVTVDQSEPRQEEGADVQRRGPMAPPRWNWVGFLLLEFGCFSEVYKNNETLTVFYTEGAPRGGDATCVCVVGVGVSNIKDPQHLEQLFATSGLSLTPHTQ